MTRAELLDRIWARTLKSMKGYTERADIERALDALCEIVREELERGGTVWLRPLGCFRVRQRPARMGRNPRTGEAAAIGERRRIVFLPSLNLKKAVGKHVSRT